MSNETIEIEVPVEQVETVVSAPTIPTEAEATAGGMSAAEIAVGKKHGLIVDKVPEQAAAKPAKKDDVVDDKGEVKDDETVEGEKPEEESPEDAAQEDIDPEKEADLVKNFNDNEKSLYWKAKKERLKRQDAQRESEHTKIKLAAIQRELDALKKVKPEVVEEENKDGEEDENRVLTVADFKKLLKDQKTEQAKQNNEVQETITRLESQEAVLKKDCPDFDEVMDLAKEMMDKHPSYRQMLLTAGADPNENAAQIAYDIGRLHPSYKKGGTGKAKEVIPAAKTKVDKAIENAEKRPSSASVSAGGTKKIVSESDLTVEDAASLSPKQWSNLKKETRERLLRQTC